LPRAGASLIHGQKKMNRLDTHKGYLDIIEQAEKTNEVQAAKRYLCQNDLFFLLVYTLNRPDIDRDWLFDRCREVEARPNGYLDLWARDHYKSSIITYGKTIQDILNDPCITVGIFSFIRPIAKSFMRQIKTDFETNEELKTLFPDIFWANPRREAPKWSEDDGIVVKRDSNPKESTVEAWGLVDGMPTGRHYKLRVYDDVITEKSVTTPDMIRKVTQAWELSQNLGTEGGKARYIGTRYHFADTYHVMKDRKSVIPREYPATVDGTQTGRPVLISPESLTTKRRDMGPYVFSCFVGGTKVLMGDWTALDIKDVKVNDVVVGYEFPKKSKSKLIKSRVVAVNSRLSNVAKFTFESGRSVICTPDHKFYTGRRGSDIGCNDTHLTYVPLGFNKADLKSAISVYDPIPMRMNYNKRDVGWLAGMFDGEGSVSGNTIQFHQSSEHNPDVCQKITEVLGSLGFDYGTSTIDSGFRDGVNHKKAKAYYIRGGRQEKIRFLNICKPVRSYKIIDALYKYGTRDFGKSNKDKLVSIEPIGNRTVYNIQTETGNYIAEGYAVKNCQMLLNPVAEEMQELKPEWIQTWPASNYTNMNIYLVCDPAGEKKTTNDFTVFTVWGLGPDGNYYVIEWVRDRLNLTERANELFRLQRQYKPDKVVYEKYGMQSDIEHYQDRMDRENYRFRIESIGGQVKKEDRIRKLIPLFEQGRIFIPETCIKRTLDGKRENLTRIFIEEEYKLFPFSVHDDMLDCMARIVDFRTDMPELADDFMGLDFSNMASRNMMAMKDFQRKQESREFNIMRDGM